MSERRTSPRVRCRLGCRIRRGRDRLRARVLDVSEGGLCVLSPVELNRGESIQIEVDVPRQGAARIQVKVWHVHKNKNRNTGALVWSVGMVLVKSDDTYARLLACAGLSESEDVDSSAVDDQLKAFRVRVQVKGEPRTRTLNLAAATAEEARELAQQDLDDSWEIVEVRSAPT